ncbi:MAG TPA: SDR family NAD(P)-dependent oxidoreductase, partial [Alcaligenes sp.]|nr:SDR family NAD(P)-dependent oxidoreductase [Alcaligenes sp.]HRL28103.1 SDR family NAD(P)-dependent oxidoreductase [Alcaligenes sp.]
MAFLQYVLRELKGKRLSQQQALELTRQYCKEKIGAPGSAARAAHPLLQENLSTLAEQRFGVTLYGDEPLLDHHRVKGSRVLPGAAHLEFARAAACQALELGLGHHDLTIENIVFVRPLVVQDTPVGMRIGLAQGEDGGVAYEVYTGEGDPGSIHSQGRVRVEPALSAQPYALPVLLDERSVSPQDCYSAFEKNGLQYGPAYQVLHDVRHGRDAQGREHVVAQLVLPDFLLAQSDAFGVHPSLLDGALQASIGLAMDESAGGGRPWLPFAIRSVRIHAAMPARVYVIVSRSLQDQADQSVRSVDLVMVDESFNRILTLEGYQSRQAAMPGSAQTVLLERIWSAQQQIRIGTPWAGHVVMFAGFSLPGLEQALASRLPQARCLVLDSALPGRVAWYEEHAAQILAALQDILRRHPSGALRVQLVLPDAEGEQAGLQGLAGMLKSAQQEHSRLHVQVLHIEAATAEHVAALVDEQHEQAAQQVRYRRGRWQQAQWQPAPEPVVRRPVWERGDVLVITGGAGGLGKVLVPYLAGQGCRLVLTGRSRLSVEQQSWLRALSESGASVEYRPLDVCDAAATQRLIAAVLDRYGRLDGLFHAAGVVNDGPVLDKTRAQLQTVFGPKVDGLINLDQATAQLALKHVVLFSSASAAFGNVGQVDYAAANGFMDAYAAWRDDQVAQGKRQGHTVSVNWPYWADGGMQMSASALELLQSRTGIRALPAEQGLAALDLALHMAVPQLAVLYGDTEKIGHLLTPVARESAPPAVSVARQAEGGGADSPVLDERIRAVLVALISALTKVPLEAIDDDMEFNEYGFDSITLTELSNRLNRDYQLDLSPTVFFEHTTVHELARHLAQCYAANFRADARDAVVADAEPDAPAPTVPVAVSGEQDVVLGRSRRSGRRPVLAGGSSTTSAPTAADP